MTGDTASNAANQQRSAGGGRGAFRRAWRQDAVGTRREDACATWAAHASSMVGDGSCCALPKIRVFKQAPKPGVAEPGSPVMAASPGKTDTVRGPLPCA